MPSSAHGVSMKLCAHELLMVLVGLCTTKQQSPPRLTALVQGRTCQAVVGRWDVLCCQQLEVGPPANLKLGKKACKGYAAPYGGAERFSGGFWDPLCTPITPQKPVGGKR